MKRSKIFLGLTATLLGVAAFAASKARFTNGTVYYTKNETSAGICTLTVSETDYALTGTNAITYSPPPGQEAFKVALTSTCKHRLYVGGE